MEKALAHIRDNKLAYSTTLVAGGIRLIPHPWNFTPVGALSLYCGARVAGWPAFLFTFVTLLISDCFLGLINMGMTADRWSPFGWFTLYIYGSLLLNTLIGKLIKHTEHPAKIVTAAAACSVQFFVLTNFMVWLLHPLVGEAFIHYTFDLAGLIDCYGAAIPFFPMTFVGDIGFAIILFSLHHVLTTQTKLFRRESVQYRSLQKSSAGPYPKATSSIMDPNYYVLHENSHDV
eukprot:GILK01001721.1.p1 GENE.GILK01001721.1~~GILK01001721.1.p1  ORF type:complete len:247 (-),score=28.55 GILK01001721.1:158-853(-)